MCAVDDANDYTKGAANPGFWAAVTVMADAAMTREGDGRATITTGCGRNPDPGPELAVAADPG